MILINSLNEDCDDLLYLGDYIPQRYGIDALTDEYSRHVLSLKWRDPHAVAFFCQRLEPLLSYNFVIALVPSHDPSKRTSGVRDLAQMLAKNNRIDGSSCLVRSRAIEKLSEGGSRSARLHNETIQATNTMMIQNKDVLLLDDVLTTGNSLQACKDILRAAGARRVKGLALAKTVTGARRFVSGPAATAQQLEIHLPLDAYMPPPKNTGVSGGSGWLPQAIAIVGVLIAIVLMIVLLLAFPGIILFAAIALVWRWSQNRR